MNNDKLRDQERAKQITALLGTDDMIYIALEIWKEFIDEDDEKEADVETVNIDVISGLIENLFDLLPSLRAARRIYSLRVLGRGSPLENTSLVQTLSSKRTARAKSAQRLLSESDDQESDFLGDRLKKRDEMVSKLPEIGSNDKLYSPSYKNDILPKKTHPLGVALTLNRAS